MKPPSGPKKTNPNKANQSQLPVPTCRVSPAPLFRVPYTLRGFTLWGVFLPLLQDLYILYPLQGLPSIALAKEGQLKEKPSF